MRYLPKVSKIKERLDSRVLIYKAKEIILRYYAMKHTLGARRQYR